MKIVEMINKMTRDEIQNLLEEYGFAVYDNESLDCLKEALHVNIEDGTITPDALDPALNRIIDTDLNSKYNTFYN